MTPMLLKIPQTSMWDKENAHAATGYFAWDQYLDFLRTRGVKHTVAVVTRVKFDPNVAYPKLLFTAARFLTAEELAEVRPLIDSEPVTKLLSGKINDGPQAPEAKVKAPALDEDDDGFAAAAEVIAEVAAKPAAVTKPAAAAKPAATAAAKAPIAEDDDDDGFGAAEPAPAATATAPVKAATTKAKAAAKAVPENVAPAVATATGADAQSALADLAAAWDDD
jgi:hypothetical protein